MINNYIHNSVEGPFLPLNDYGSCGGDTSQGYANRIQKEVQKE